MPGLTVNFTRQQSLLTDKIALSLRCKDQGLTRPAGKTRKCLSPKQRPSLTKGEEKEHPFSLVFAKEKKKGCAASCGCCWKGSTIRQQSKTKRTRACARRPREQRVRTEEMSVSQVLTALTQTVQHFSNQYISLGSLLKTTV